MSFPCDFKPTAVDCSPSIWPKIATPTFHASKIHTFVYISSPLQTPWLPIYSLCRNLYGNLNKKKVTDYDRKILSGPRIKPRTFRQVHGRSTTELFLSTLIHVQGFSIRCKTWSEFTELHYFWYNFRTSVKHCMEWTHLAVRTRLLLFV